MSAQRTVPPSRTANMRLKVGALVVVVLAAVAAYFAGMRAGAVQDVLSASPADAVRVAFVRKQPCVGGWCETIWMGKTKDDAIQVASLSAGTEHCDFICPYRNSEHFAGSAAWRAKHKK